MARSSHWIASPHGVLGRLAPGARIAGYVIEEQVGAGGMAVVFRARDEMLGRLAAIKIMAPSLAADEEFRTRFLRECRAVASVDHPHIIPVYGSGEIGGLLYIATRFVSDGDLGTLLRRNRGPLVPPRAASLISQVASALDAAHAAGLVHRDVKPGNVLVDAVQDRPEHVYLSDFGLSKRVVSSPTNLTATGQFMGTPDYCAPEQIRGRNVDGRSDQYALACVAFILLTGVPPFPRPDTVATLFAHVNDPAPLASDVLPGLSPAVSRVLAQAMAKNPGGRYTSCGEFADELRNATLARYPSAQSGKHQAPVRGPTHYSGGSRDVPTNGPSVSGATFPPQAPLTRETISLSSDTRRRPVPASHPATGTEPPSHAGTPRPNRRVTAILAGSVALILAVAGAVAALALPGSNSHAGPAANPASAVTVTPSSAVTPSATTVPPAGGITYATYTGTTATPAGKAVAYAFAQLGCRYRYGATGPCIVGFDAPGLVKSAWASAGVSIPSDASAQWAALPHVPSSSLQPGDLLFYNSIGHVAMYVGGGMIIDAPAAGEAVRELSMNTAWYSENYDGAARPTVSSPEATVSSSPALTASEATAKAMLPSFGFNQTTQWTCLYNLWEYASSWSVGAENAATGAYGIPQALPGDKMASAGPDWQTDATTQIRWGLGYIKSVYGTPCGAWQNEMNDGTY
jgi:serine/threonine protein kinase